MGSNVLTLHWNFGFVAIKFNYMISMFVELIFLFYVCRIHTPMTLSNAEEQLMQYLWKQKKAVMKSLIEAYGEPKPAATTIATLLKRMQDKGFVDYKQMGRSREYFPLVKKNDYFSNHVNGLIKNFFNDNPAQFASFFTEKTKFTKSLLQELRDIFEQIIVKK